MNKWKEKEMNLDVNSDELGAKASGGKFFNVVLYDIFNQVM